MNWFEAIILGAVQGATEFLPVSSSGHLTLGQHLLGVPEPGLLFDIILHVGTLVSVMAFYRREILDILVDLRDGLGDLTREKSFGAFARPDGVRVALLVVAATIPTGIIGVLLGDLIEPEGAAPLITPRVVCGILIVNAFILALNKRFLERDGESSRTGPLAIWGMNLPVALAIGVVQGIAVLPGLSRSGLTITLALALGVERVNAARYSFLLSIPAILGALVLKLDPVAFANMERLGIFLAGAAVAAVVGYACLLLLTLTLERARFHHFSSYCLLVGVLGLVFLR